jgi:hypothetical protein
VMSPVCTVRCDDEADINAGLHSEKRTHRWEDNINVDLKEI